MPEEASPRPSDEHAPSSPITDRAGGSPLVHFYIPATSSLLERRPRTLKAGDMFGLFDHYGDIVAGPGSPEGLYYRDTRILSQFRLSVAGCRPLLLGSLVTDDNLLLKADLTNPDLFDEEGGLLLPRDTLHIMRTRILHGESCLERLRLQSFRSEPLDITLELAFASDFADLFEVRGHRPKSRGRTHVERVGEDRVVLSYRAGDGRWQRTILTFDPPPDRLRADTAEWRLRLEGDRRLLHVHIDVEEGEARRPAARRSFAGCLRVARRNLRRASGRAAVIATSNELFNEVIRRAIADLYMLITDTPWGPYPYAGIPWFSTAFGRDGIITAMQMLWIDPEVARGVLRFLAATQATEEDPEADAEPGKIMHETRQGELARLGEVPFGRYYGSVDATPLFVLLAGMYFERTRDIATLRELWPHILAALDWIDRYGDRDGDGFVEYARASRTGLANQGWKDSADSIFHADGRLAEGPIALVEVQGYVYAARRHAAEMARVLGQWDRARREEEAATRLARRFDEAFWSEEIGCYALALDGAKRPCLVRSSNAGQLLFTGIVPRERAARLARLLLGSSFFSGWGIRTVAVGEARYNPMSYHNGSIWPHDNALVARGLAAYGFRTEALKVLNGLVEAAGYMDLRRLPELFCGFPRQPTTGPTHYPVACAPQAWASGAILSLLQSCLGLQIDAAARIVQLVHPRLPAFLDEVRLRNLRLGDARVDLLLRRHGQDVAVNLLEREGDLGVEVCF